MTQRLREGETDWEREKNDEKTVRRRDTGNGVDREKVRQRAGVPFPILQRITADDFYDNKTVGIEVN